MTSKELGLGAAIRAWRDRINPIDVGLRPDTARRAAGLRREELAQLAGISVDYTVRLEQGRAGRPSPNVVAALARVLRLTAAERDHLYCLAGLAPPAFDEVSDTVPGGILRVLNRLGDVAVAVFAADWQLIWWNQSWSALLGDPRDAPPSLRNFARDTFPVGDLVPQLCRRAVTPSRETLEVALVSDLRRASGRYPNSARLSSLIRNLQEGNERFTKVWASGVVGTHREDQKLIEHPLVGSISVECDILHDDDTDQKIVILTAAPGTQDDTRYRQALQSNTV